MMLSEWDIERQEESTKANKVGQSSNWQQNENIAQSTYKFQVKYIYWRYVIYLIYVDKYNMIV